MEADALSGSFWGTLWTMGDVLLRWVPATLTNLIHAVETSNPPSEPVSAWAMPHLIAGAESGPVYDSIVHTWAQLTLFSFALSAPFLGIVVYSIVRTLQIRRIERAEVEAAQHHGEHHESHKSKRRWDRVMEQIGSDKPDGWRLAVLEADIMLNELLDMRGYKGETMADKMKQVDRADFNTIDLAWEAHKYRNKIAHESAESALEYREARRIIALFERVFKEFGLVE